MSQQIAELDVLEGRLVVRLSDSPAAALQVFFVNVIGFEKLPESDGHGFIRELDAKAGRHIASAIRFLESKNYEARPTVNAQRLLDSRAAIGRELAEARVKGVSCHENPASTINLPPEFIRTLKPYQVPAVQHMIDVSHSANFSVPGSGKTTMVLAAYAALKARGEVTKLVIIGPRSCFAPWEEEFKGCFGRGPTSVRLVGTPAERMQLYEKLRHDSSDFALVTYATAANDAAELASFLLYVKTMLVLDESHYVKKLRGGRAATVRDLAPLAKKRAVLSGTPVPNGMLDIWSQMTYLWPDPPLLGTQDQFKDRLQRGGDGADESVREHLNPFFWRVKKSDVDLPAPTYHSLVIPMRPYQSAIYGALAAKVLSDVIAQPSEREKLRRWRSAKMVRLLQAASNPSLLTERSLEFKLPPLSGSGLAVSELIENYSKYERPAKLEAAAELAKKLIAKGEKVILWSSFIHNLKTLESMLHQFQPRVIHGMVARDESEDVDVNREKLIQEFKTKEQFPLLIANPGACAESISLHRVCKQAIYCDRSFNGAQYMQSLDRIHRLGMKPDDKVHYYLMSSLNTVDEVVDVRLRDKQERLTKLLEGDLVTVDLDETGVSAASELEGDFIAVVGQLRAQFGSEQ